MEFILERLGYIKKERITLDYINEEYGRLIGNPTDYSISKELDQEFYDNLRRIDGVRDYFKATAAKDMLRYFQATGAEEQSVVRGAFARTMYILGKLKE
jgi:hypothetical protein